MGNRKKKMLLIALMILPLSGCGVKKESDFILNDGKYSEGNSFVTINGDLPFSQVAKSSDGYSGTFKFDISKSFYCSSDGRVFRKSAFVFYLTNPNNGNNPDTYLIPNEYTAIYDTGTPMVADWYSCVWLEGSFKDEMCFTFDSTTISVNVPSGYVSWDLNVGILFTGNTFSKEEGDSIIKEEIQAYKDALNPFAKFFEVTIPDWWNGMIAKCKNWLYGMKDGFNSSINGALGTSGTSSAISSSTSVKSRQGRILNE